MILLAALACAPEPEPHGTYPLDDLLRFNDIQAVGTHNSYHEKTPGIEVPAWDYEMAPLDVQLRDQGVRQLELDVWFDPDSGDFAIYHVPDVDQTSSCSTLSECLGVMKAWSDENPGHHPLFMLLEVKDDFDAATAPALLAALDETVNDTWPTSRRVSPDDVQRDYGSLAEGLAAEGWPTLGELRGRALFVLHTDADYRQVYTTGDTTTAGLALFPDAHGDTSLAVSAVSTINDPVVDIESITAALTANQLVRTRADSDTEQARSGDTSIRDAGLASGANFVSTDFPVAYEPTGYIVAMPGGTPSRCNPVTAPEECTSEAIEDPELLPW